LKAEVEAAVEQLRVRHGCRIEALHGWIHDEDEG
jgi:hypothetical protein